LMPKNVFFYLFLVTLSTLAASLPLSEVRGSPKRVMWRTGLSVGIVAFSVYLFVVFTTSFFVGTATEPSIYSAYWSLFRGGSGISVAASLLGPSLAAWLIFKARRIWSAYVRSRRLEMAAIFAVVLLVPFLPYFYSALSTPKSASQALENPAPNQTKLREAI
jgi:hypothetical protein